MLHSLDFGGNKVPQAQDAPGELKMLWWWRGAGEDELTTLSRCDGVCLCVVPRILELVLTLHRTLQCIMLILEDIIKKNIFI